MMLIYSPVKRVVVGAVRVEGVLKEGYVITENSKKRYRKMRGEEKALAFSPALVVFLATLLFTDPSLVGYAFYLVGLLSGVVLKELLYAIILISAIVFIIAGFVVFLAFVYGIIAGMWLALAWRFRNALITEDGVVFAVEEV